MLKSCNSSSTHYSVFNGDIHSSILPYQLSNYTKKYQYNYEKC